MKHVLLIVSFFIIQNVFSQAEQVEIITHRVELGETMLMISKKYLVNPTEIYKLNKSAIDGITPGMVLAVPQPIKSQEIIAARTESKQNPESTKEPKQYENIEVVSEIEIDSTTSETPKKKLYKLKGALEKNFIEHEVKAGETIESLSEKYEIPIEEIKLDNETVLKNGIKVGQILQILVIPKLESNQEEEQTKSTTSIENIIKTTTDSLVIHEVTFGETLFSIARKYNIAVKDIQKQNQSVLKNGLKAGQELSILVKKSTISDDNNNSNATIENNTSSDEEEITHQVVYGETLYSISRKYNIPVKDIQKQNETVLKNGLLQGQELKIRIKK